MKPDAQPNDEDRGSPKAPDKPEAHPRRPKKPIEGEQPLADDESKCGGIEGAVGGGQSGQGGG